MTRAEFMDALQRTLSGALGSSTVNGHMRYYQEYFDSQMSLGKSEEEIVAELGNPRLIAKTIIEAAKREGMGTPEYDEVYEDGTADRTDKSRLTGFRMPGWLWLVFAIMITGAFVGIGGSLALAALSVLFPVLCVDMLIRLFWRK